MIARGITRRFSIRACRTSRFIWELPARSRAPCWKLGCGTGRLLWPLRREGIPIEGLDGSPAMLEACRELGQRAGLSAPLHFGDWRSFDLGRRFAALLLPFNGLQHLCGAQDLAAFFERVRAHLQPGGLFALDLHLPQPALLAREADEHYGVEEGPLTPEGERVIAESSRYDPWTQVLTQTWTLAGADDRQRELSLQLRQFFPQELRALLDQQGLEILSHAAGFQAESFEGAPLKQVLICKKR